MKQLRLEIAINPQPDEIEFVTQQVIEFNRSRVDHIAGGIIGETYWQWLYVDLLWVSEAFRGQGYGDALLAAAEQEAINRECQYAYLNTFSFQAPEFYQKRGYVIFGELPDFPQGHKRYFLKKELR